MGRYTSDGLAGTILVSRGGIWLRGGVGEELGSRSLFLAFAGRLLDTFGPRTGGTCRVGSGVFLKKYVAARRP